MAQIRRFCGGRNECAVRCIHRGMDTQDEHLGPYRVPAEVPTRVRPSIFALRPRELLIALDVVVLFDLAF